MKNVAVILLFILILIGGGILLQIFLSRMKSKWFGLILPTITLLCSLLMVLGVAIYNGMTGIEILIMIGSVFLMGNIPTIVLLGINFGCREKIKRRSQLEKMSIQDLE